MMKILPKLVATLMLLGSQAAFAACNIDVDVGDALTFSATQVTVEKSCGSVTLNMKHTGKLAASVLSLIHI